MDISEVSVTPEGETEYRCLYRYNIIKNDCENGEFHTEGYFEKVNTPSLYLQTLLTRSGIPQSVLAGFIGKESNI